MRAVLIGLAALLAAAASPAQEIALRIVSPRPGLALFDVVEVRVEVRGGASVDRIAFLLDGARIGAVDEPPWALDVDTGPENRDKLLQVVAYGSGRELARARLVAPAFPIDERVELPLQQLFTTVTDRRGRRVTGLAQDAFSLRDDRQRQEIVTFAGGEIPFTATLLIDGSHSMVGKPLKIVLSGAEIFVSGMRPLDQSRIVVCSDRLLQVTPFITVEQGLDRRWLEVEARGGTAILDHLYMALAELETRLGRRVLILLSDGLDLHSATSPAGLREVARRSQALVYWVRPGPLLSADLVRPVPLSSWTSADDLEETLATLEEIVDASGGRIVPVPDISRAGAAFADILAELREQYALGYYPDDLRRDGSWRKVRVKVTGRHRARTQSGYYDRPRSPQ